MGCIPFKAAIFDLDGTLLDSMYVWSKVDEVFFGRRGMAVPPTYGSEVAGMSYRETAEFTVRKYMPNERWQDLIEEWTRLSEEEYAQRVPLKKGSYAYLRMLKREGVRLAIASALTPNLYKPCLKRLGLDELFEVVCSTEHTNGRGKASGEIYLLAASKLGVEPSDCVVFEDALAGIMGAKAVGMDAYAIREPHVAGDIPKIEAMADYTMDCIDEMRNIHPFTTSPRCVIFTAYCEGDPAKAYEAEADDFIVSADAGWKIAVSLGLQPALTIGDFDSGDAPEVGEIQRWPVVKDDTDALLCLKEGMRRGYDRFLLVGGMGGRLDHSLSNLQSLAFASTQGVSIEMADGKCRVYALHNGSMILKRRKGKFSVLSHCDVSRGVSIRNAEYRMENGTMTNTFPLGCSNGYIGDQVEIEVKDGTLIILQTDDGGI